MNFRSDHQSKAEYELHIEYFWKKFVIIDLKKCGSHSSLHWRTEQLVHTSEVIVNMGINIVLTETTSTWKHRHCLVVMTLNEREAYSRKIVFLRKHRIDAHIS